MSHRMQNPLRSAQHSPFGPVQARRTPHSTAHHARFYHYQPPVLLTLTPSHQSKPIGHTLRSGLVQNIFSSPARLVYVFALLTPTCRHAAKLKMLCLGRSRPWLRRTRGLCEFNYGKKRREGVPRVCGGAQAMRTAGGKRMVGEERGEKRGCRSGKKRSVRWAEKGVRGALKHAYSSSWREPFHAATVTTGGERSWISAVVSRWMTFIGPPHLGQG